MDDKKLGDILKRVVTTGVSAAFMTEEAVKGLLQDLPLPKEALAGLLQNAKNTKDEFITGVKNELKEHLNKIDVSKEIEKVLDNYDLNVSANVSFNKKKKAKAPKANE